MDLDLFKEILSFDSTSGKERELGEWLATRLKAPSVKKMEVGDGTLNLLFSWGTPRVVFCTHMDTVPPYIAPSFEKDRVRGRGSCDAKGQIVSMYVACKELESEGKDGFGLLLLSGEETGSFGAKAFSKTGFEAPFLIVGEPTENKMVSWSKGTKSYDLVFKGEPFHSGYPQFGVSAVDLFHNFYTALKNEFPGDDPLGCTWNVGLLRSDNPQNILSEKLSCRLYFRTTFSSDSRVVAFMEEAGKSQRLDVTARGGDSPANYVTPDGFESAPVSFGSDAPHLTGFGHKIICGPGSIRFAHRGDEHILLEDMERAVSIYKRLFSQL